MKILITDDELIARKIYRMVLEPQGHTVLDCLNNETLEKEGPTADLIIADYDTFVKFEHVLKYNRPTILASGSCVNHTNTLPKPFTRDELLNAIENLKGEIENAKVKKPA